MDGSGSKDKKKYRSTEWMDPGLKTIRQLNWKSAWGMLESGSG